MRFNFLKHKKEEFGTSEAGLACLLFVIFNFSFMQMFYLLAKNFGLTFLGLIFAQFLVEALFGIVSVVVAISAKVDLAKASGMNKKINVKIVIYSLLIAVCSIFFFASLTNSFIEFLTLLGYKSSNSSIDLSTFPKYLGYVVATCITPAVCEELLFRGTIEAGLKKYGKVVAVVSSALIFMLMHGGPEQTVHQFIIGAILGIIFFETGNLWLGVLIHFFNNFISITEVFVVNMLLRNVKEEIVESEVATEVATSSLSWTSFCINLIIALVLAYIGYKLMKILIRKITEESKRINGELEAPAEENALSEANKANVSDNEFAIDLNDYVIKTEDGTPIENNLTSEKPKEEKMSTTTKILFSLSIAYLIFEWVITLIGSF